MYVYGLRGAGAAAPPDATVLSCVLRLESLLIAVRCVAFAVMNCRRPLSLPCSAAEGAATTSSSGSGSSWPAGLLNFAHSGPPNCRFFYGARSAPTSSLRHYYFHSSVTSYFTTISSLWQRYGLMCPALHRLRRREHRTDCLFQADCQKTTAPPAKLFTAFAPLLLPTRTITSPIATRHRNTRPFHTCGSTYHLIQPVYEQLQRRKHGAVSEKSCRQQLRTAQLPNRLKQRRVCGAAAARRQTV